LQLQAFHNQRPQAIAATGFPQPCGRGHRPLQPQAFHNHAAAGHFHWSAATATGHGSQLATGPTVTSGTLARGAAAKCVEKDDEEEEKRQAELRRVQDQLKKCLEDEDYTGAAAVKEHIAALMRQAKLRRGSAVTGTQLGIAANATCCIITARMGRFVTCWASLVVPQRKHVMPTDRHRLATCFDQ
jgi:hypothetical protein